MKSVGILYHFLRLGFGAMFLYTGIIHAADPAAFALAVANYRLLPDILINFFAVVLPWAEIVCALCLISGRFVAGASMIITLMLLAFTIALVSALVRGLDISCGCFSTDPDAARITWWYLVRDIALTLAGMALFLLNSQKGTASPHGQEP